MSRKCNKERDSVITMTKMMMTTMMTMEMKVWMIRTTMKTMMIKMMMRLVISEIWMMTVMNHHRMIRARAARVEITR